MNYCMLSLCRLLVIAAISGAATLKPPVWPKTYSVKGALHLPNDDHERQFLGWFDEGQRLSRIDYYDGMVKTIQRGAGRITKIIPTSDAISKDFNLTKCYSQNEISYIQPTLPPADDNYVYSGDVTYRNWTAKLFIYKEKAQFGKIIHKILVRYSEDGPLPIRFDVMKYNHADVHDRLYEHYYLDYYYYSKRSIPSSIFDIEPNDCIVKGTSEYLNPMEPFIEPKSFGTKSGKFVDFVEKFRRRYNDELEREYRKGIFLRNLEFIESENRANRGFKLAINQFADRTDEEFASMLGDRPSQDHVRAKPFTEDMRQAPFPNQFDWRLRGAVTPVKNQLHCGASYAFSVTGAVEGAYYLATGNLVRLSEQAIIDCSWTHDQIRNEGCRIGIRLQTFYWVTRMGGIPLDASYRPFLGMEGYCMLPTILPMAGNISGYVRVTANDTDALKLAIYKHGPVSISIDASRDTFKFYSSGIYFDSKCNNSERGTNHGALAIGYGITSRDGKDPRKYWLVKNSWGPNWGVDGYALIAAGSNDCGVTSSPIYVTMDNE